MNACEYCCETIYHDKDRKVFPDDLPDDLPQSNEWDTMFYHSWCFEKIVDVIPIVRLCVKENKE